MSKLPILGYRVKRRRGRTRTAFYCFLAVSVLGLAGWVWWRRAKQAELEARGRPEAHVPTGHVARVLPPVPMPLTVPAPPVLSLPRTNWPPANALSASAHRLAPSVGLPGRPLELTVRTNLWAPTPKPRPVQDVLEAQLALARLGFSPGSLDGGLGSQTRAALRAFQQKEGLPMSGALDIATEGRLVLDVPPLSTYVITSNDLARLWPVSRSWLGKSRQPRLDYETVLELVAEKSCSHPKLIRRLNPAVDWSDVPAGTSVVVPNVAAPLASAKAAFVRIYLGSRTLEVFDANTNLLAHFPCSIGQEAARRPVGELHVAVVAPNPTYTFNPEIFPESEEARELGQKMLLPPGPNNPVGTAWIGLDRPGYGIHGTPKPEEVGRSESHGCFRLSNWNADYLARLVGVGTPVIVEQ
jgi:lipoprotein-anchoring transpeptidase ErfK/SrfK